MHNLICKWCREAAQWSRFLNTYWCPDCRCDDLEENDDA